MGHANAEMKLAKKEYKESNIIPNKAAKNPKLTRELPCRCPLIREPVKISAIKRKRKLTPRRELSRIDSIIQLISSTIWLRTTNQKILSKKSPLMLLGNENIIFCLRSSFCYIFTF